MGPNSVLILMGGHFFLNTRSHVESLTLKTRAAQEEQEEEEAKTTSAMATRQTTTSVSSENENEQDEESSEGHTPPDDEGDFRRYWQCGRGCCGTPWDSDVDECIVETPESSAESDEGESSEEGGESKPSDLLIKPDSSNALAYFNAAPAALWTSAPPPIHPMTALDRKKIVTDEHVKLLVVSYRRHFAEHCTRKRRRVTQRFPYVVWEKVYADFLSKFPDTNFDVSVLKSHLKAGLCKYKSPPPVALYPDRMSLAGARSSGLLKKKPVKPTPAAKVTPVTAKPLLSPVVNAAPFSLDVNWERMAAAQAPYPLAVAAVAQIMAAAAKPTTATRGPLALSAKPVYGAGADGIIPADEYSQLARNDQIKPAAANTMPPAPAVEQQKQIMTTGNGPCDDESGVRQATAIDQTSPEGNSALQSDPVSTATNTQEPLESSSPQVRSLKRRVRANRLELQELKKQKVSLEILNLALELGVFTREECTERGHCLWLSWEKPS